MSKDETYYFHQTPNSVVIELLKEMPFEDGDNVLDSFRGEGVFYNNFPANVNKDWCEILEGRDFKDYDKPIDWVVTNPPFRLDMIKRINSFYFLVDWYASRVNKGIAFLANDSCFSTLTPKRLKAIGDNHNFYIHKIVVCNIKKWRGRYFFIIFKKGKNDFYKYVLGNH